jgi:hypothetical protein
MKYDSHKTVEWTGAVAGSILLGVNPNNHGLRLHVLREQASGDGGPIAGDVRVLDVGNNKHSAALAGLLGEQTNAAAILSEIRRVVPGCVSVVNKNILIAEPSPATSLDTQATAP